MKKSSLIGLVVFFVIMLFLQPFYGCTDKEKSPGKNVNPGLEVIMELSQEHYNNMGFESTASPIAYHVKMLVTNTSKKDIQYSQVFSGFVPENKKALYLKISLFLDKTGTEATAAHPFVLKPGKTEEYNFTTNGYTMDLLADAKNKPLLFVMLLLLGEEEVIYQSPHVELPPIGNLPSYELSQFKSEVKPFRIKLTQ